jgi:hypothetical protein
MLQAHASEIIDQVREPAGFSRSCQLFPRIAVLIPCYNEQVCIGKVVEDFRAALPQAMIYVYDNNSSDRTSLAAHAAGAVVRIEELQGKGHVVRRMFADLDADVYLLVDGDDTYDAAAAPRMVQLLVDKQLDMVSAARVSAATDAYRPGHRTGNKILAGLVHWIFGGRITDVLSGYRAFSRRFVKSFPALSNGFEIETEFTVHALELRLPIDEVPAAYRGRPAGSTSKLRTWHDGVCILCIILLLVKEQRPLQLCALGGAMMLLTGSIVGLPAVAAVFGGDPLPHTLSTLLASGLTLLASLTIGCGLILHSVARARTEIKRFAYLAVPTRHAAQ